MLDGAVLAGAAGRAIVQRAHPPLATVLPQPRKLVPVPEDTDLLPAVVGQEVVAGQGRQEAEAGLEPDHAVEAQPGLQEGEELGGRQEVEAAQGEAQGARQGAQLEGGRKLESSRATLVM